MIARRPGGVPLRARTTRTRRALVARVLAPLWVGLWAWLGAAPALADDAQVFEIGKNRFDAGRYEEAAERLQQMLEPAAPPCDEPGTPPDACRLTDLDYIERARALAAASLIALRRGREADVHIERLLLANPTYTPSPALFPQEVLDRFAEVRGRIRAELEAATRQRAEREREKRLAEQKRIDDERRWIRDVVRLAREERVTVENSRLVAMLPFGAGQFQNGDTSLGWFFAVSQALSGGGSIASAAIVGYYGGIDPRAADADGQPISRAGLNENIQTMTTVNRISFGAWALLTVAGIAHAQATFVPERARTQPRPVPPPPAGTVVPGVSFLPGGATFELGGRF